MITKVRLRNWRSHGDTMLDFCEGTNALIGSMGSGKTSTLDAICFALFGTFPALNAKKICIEDIISKKPKQQKEAEIDVHFCIGDVDWSVRRIISKTKATSAELRKGGALVEGPQPGRVNEEIERLLRVDYDTFTRAIYSEQNGIDYFLTIPKGARMRKIDELLSIDRFEKARASVVALVNRFNSTVSDRRALVAGMESDPALAGLPTLVKDIEAGESERKRLEVQLDAARENAERIMRSVAEMRRRYEELQKLLVEIEKAKALIAGTEADVDELKRTLTVEEIESAELTNDQLQEKLNSAAAQENMLKAGCETESAKLDELRAATGRRSCNISFLEGERIPQLEAALRARREIEAELRKNSPKKLQEDIQEKSRSIDRARAAIQRAEIQVEQLQESLRELERVGAACPICDQPLSEHKKELIAKRRLEQIEKLKAQVERGNASVYRLTEELAALENQMAAARTLEARLAATSDADSQLKSARGSAATLRSELSSLETESRMMEKALGMLRTEHETAHRTAERLRTALLKREQLTYKTERIRELQRNITALNEQKAHYRGLSAAELERIDNERITLASSVSSLAARLDAASSLLNERRARLAELEGKKRQLDFLKSELERLLKLAEQLRLLESSLEATQHQLRHNFVVAVNQAMSELWSNLYPYSDFASCRLTIDEGDYVLELADSTGWVPADGVASGGERALACLALRIAFALVLAPQLRWLVLDEPTHNLDAQAVEELAATLRDRISQFIDQVFLITHDPALESAVTGYLYKLERDKGTDGSTVAVRVAE